MDLRPFFRARPISSRRLLPIRRRYTTHFTMGSPQRDRANGKESILQVLSIDMEEEVLSIGSIEVNIQPPPPPEETDTKSAESMESSLFDPLDTDSTEEDSSHADHANEDISVEDDDSDCSPITRYRKGMMQEADLEDRPRPFSPSSISQTMSKSELLSVTSSPYVRCNSPGMDRIEQILRDAMEQRDELRPSREPLDLSENASLRQSAIKSWQGEETESESTEHEEKKEASPIQSPGSHVSFQAGGHPSRMPPPGPASPELSSQLAIALVRSISATESDVGSVDGLPSTLQDQWDDDGNRREKMMEQLDGVLDREKSVRPASPEPKDANVSYTPAPDSIPAKASDEKESFFDSWPFQLQCALCGPSTCAIEEDNFDGNDPNQQSRGGWIRDDDTLALLGCANVIHRDRREGKVPKSLIRLTHEPPPPSYAETIRATEVDPRLQSWVANHYKVRDSGPSDGTYYLGKSQAVIVHEIVRGNWTWCTEWSPNGDLLAIATENHHLAVVDTTSSTVWQVRHDQRIRGPVKNGTTHSIRSISWGTHYIAIGGTGNAVSLLSPIEPFPVVHSILETGFVGSLHWKVDSDVLAIGSRLNKALIVRVTTIDAVSSLGQERQIEAEVLHTIQCKNWVNRVAFSPGGTCLAVGDAGGVVSVFSFVDEPRRPIEVKLVTSFTLEDSVLDVEWSPDGHWLYAGGEDFNVSVIDTNHWELVHKVHRDRWVQCISASHTGSHVAVGGVSAEMSILDVANGWDSVMGVQLKGLVPLSAKWHPRDQYLALTGQSNSILAVETTNARHVRGHHLYSMSSILDIEFSPDSRMCVVGNEYGVVTIFSLSGSTFEVAYELAVPFNDRLSIEWSLNNLFVVVATKTSILTIQRNRKVAPKKKGKKGPPTSLGFSVQHAIHGKAVNEAVAIDSLSQYVAVTGSSTRILDVANEFKQVREWEHKETCRASAWSPDGRWLATVGDGKVLSIYDTGDERVDQWRKVFSLACQDVGRALAWGPIVSNGLIYLAHGGDAKEITILEIRSLEGTWETVLRIPRESTINDLDWNNDGFLAAGIGNGTVSIVDLGYLQSGVAVNEMDYNWQRQALTCFTEIRRNRGRNSMTAVRWIPSAPGSDSLLAAGGTDGEVEIIDLTERERCRGYVRRDNPMLS